MSSINPITGPSKTPWRKPYGRIYSITHPGEKGCYIGKTTVSLKERWKGHLRQARDAFKRRSDEIQRSDGKLHQRIDINRATIDQFVVVELDVAYSKRELVRLEYEHILRHDSIKSGWNIVLPNPDDCVDELDEGETHLIDGRECRAKSFSDLCRQNSVAYSTAIYWRKSGKSVEEAILRARTAKNIPEKIYIVHRQGFKSIRAIADDKSINRNNVGFAALKRRIGKAIKAGKTKPAYDERTNIERIELDPKILRPPRRHRLYEVSTPDGRVGPASIKELQRRLRNQYPGVVPKRYTTIQAGLTRYGFTPEQAFGFEVHPNYREVDELVVENGYKYSGRGFVAYAKPVVLHQTREVFYSQADFADTYGIAVDLVSDRLKEGKTPEEVLAYYKRQP